MTDTRRVSIVLFEGFELLDVFGPVQLFSILPESFALEFVGPGIGPVPSSQGVEVSATASYETASPAEIVLVPGGIGTRRLVGDPDFLAWLRRHAAGAEIVASVCTGSAVLAAAGLLDGRRATSNKRSFRWVQTQGPRVEWVARARWVEDGDRWTSSGVAAGMDMTAALIRKLHGDEAAEKVAALAELEVHRDASWDPFAEQNGLV